MRRVALAAAVGLALVACGDGDDPGTGAASSTSAAPNTTAAFDTSVAPETTVGSGATTAPESTTVASSASVVPETSTATEVAGIDPDQQFPDVVDAELTADGSGAFTVAVTLSSPYDTPERYADAWRVLGTDGVVYGVRELAHDHQFEQPFTRSLSGVEIPAGVSEVTIEGRDQVYGWGGATMTIPVPTG